MMCGKESACQAGNSGSIPGSGRSPGGGNGNPLQHSCLENPMGRGVWRATVHGVKNESDLTEATEHMCKTDSCWEAVVQHRELKPVLCDDLERWDGRGAHEGGRLNISILMADSHCCMAETNTTW